MKRKEHQSGRKHCAACDKWKPLSDFHSNTRNWDRLHAYCRPCMADAASKRYQKERPRLLQQAKKYRSANPEKRKAIALRFKYGLEIKDYNQLLEAQGRCCAICRERSELHVDHCHRTGVVRGLLCMACNTAIGALGDDPERIRSAASYLEQRR